MNMNMNMKVRVQKLNIQSTLNTRTKETYIGAGIDEGEMRDSVHAEALHQVAVARVRGVQGDHVQAVGELLLHQAHRGRHLAAALTPRRVEVDNGGLYSSK